MYVKQLTKLRLTKKNYMITQDRQVFSKWLLGQRFWWRNLDEDKALLVKATGKRKKTEVQVVILNNLTDHPDFEVGQKTWVNANLINAV